MRDDLAYHYNKLSVLSAIVLRYYVCVHVLRKGEVLPVFALGVWKAFSRWFCKKNYDTYY